MNPAAPKAVFLSYASQDRDAARQIAQALRADGIEVWFDESELRGGEAWDASIRRQIAECALFVPIISASTQARREGYFRLEWRLAAQRTYMMSEQVAFLLPVVIDATRDAEADVPGEFKAVQWTRIGSTDSLSAFCERVRNLMGGAEPARGALGPEVVVESRHDAAPTAERSARPWLVPAIVSVGAVAALALWQPWASKAPPVAPATAAPVHPIAVLAFANMSADKENTEYFSDGISEEILNALDRIPTLSVTPRTSSFSFKGKNVALDEIGRTLRVASVIEGSVRKVGNKVRATVKLLNAADGVRIWSEDFEFEMNDVFAVQSEIAAKVAQKLVGGAAAPATTVTVAARAETKNLAAYDAFLRARATDMSGSSPTLIAEAIRLYKEAVRLDPNYALAWACLAQIYIRDFSVNGSRSNETQDNARNAATRALQLDSHLPQALLAFANFHLLVDYDFDTAQRELDQLERLRPNEAGLPAAQAFLEFARGNWSEKLVALAARAAERDPQNADAMCSMGSLLAKIGRFAEADPFFDLAWEGRAFPWPLRLKALALVAWTGDVQAALALLETCPELIRNHWFHHTLAEVITLQGGAGAALLASDRFRTAVRRAPPNYGHRSADADATYRMGWHEARLGNPVRADERYAEALVLATKLAGEFPREFSPRFQLAMIHARRGHKAAARAATEEAMRLSARLPDLWQIGDAHFANAEVLTVLGNSDAAIAELRTLHEMGFGLGYTLRLDPRWESLRPHLKFQQLIKEAEARADAQPRPKK